MINEIKLTQNAQSKILDLVKDDSQKNLDNYLLTLKEPI